MNGRLKLHLKANERLFINGAVIKVDRKVAIELLNDVVFLLESHVMQEAQATTPLRQLYFVVQSMLVEPRTQTLARQLYEQQHNMLILTFKSQDILEGLIEVRGMIDRGKPFDALKRLRTMFAIEDEILGNAEPASGEPVQPGKAVA